MSVLWGSFRLQARLIVADRDYLLDLIRAPLLAVVFLALVRHSGRDDLTVNAVLAPMLAAVWGMALLVAGEIIDTDRWLGVLEPAVATPARFATVVRHRIVATTALSLVAVAEVWLVAVAGFRVTVAVHHPAVFAVALLATLAATVGTALLMAALFVVTRTARTFQNSLSYPVLLLGGVFVPVAALPDWLRVPSRVVYLSWSSDLLRDSMRVPSVAAVGERVAAILVLGAMALVLGHLALNRALRRLRATGSLALR